LQRAGLASPANWFYYPSRGMGDRRARRGRRARTWPRRAIL